MAGSVALVYLLLLSCGWWQADCIKFLFLATKPWEPSLEALDRLCDQPAFTQTRIAGNVCSHSEAALLRSTCDVKGCQGQVASATCLRVSLPRRITCTAQCCPSAKLLLQGAAYWHTSYILERKSALPRGASQCEPGVQHSPLSSPGDLLCCVALCPLLGSGLYPGSTETSQAFDQRGLQQRFSLSVLYKNLWGPDLAWSF